MAWYRTGTISLTNGSAAVAGSGTAWIANAAPGEALRGPDGRLYEISSVNSDTSMTLATPYLGATVGGQTYEIFPSQSYIRDLAAQAAGLVNSYASFYNTVGQGKFPDGSAGAPAISFSNDTDTGIRRSGSGGVAIVGNGVDQAVFSGGHLGIGVAPNTWFSSRKALSISTGGVSYAGVTDGTAEIWANSLLDASGTPVGITTAGAALYQVNRSGNGSHVWHVCGSTSAGQPISFTQAMTLDAMGNLGIGTNSPATRLTIRSPHATATTTTATGALLMHDEPNGVAARLGAGVAYNSGDQIAWIQSNSAYGLYPLAINPAGGEIRFGAGFMKIDGYGKWMLEASESTPAGSGVVYVPSANTSAPRMQHCHASGVASGSAYTQYLYAGIEIGSITQNGTTAVAYNTTSDPRLKTNVRPADAKRFMDIRFVDFEWVDGRHDCGVIAPQLQSVYPDLVIGEKDATEIRTIEITPAVTEQRLVTEAVLDENGVEVTPAQYETVEIQPAVTEDREFPVYQQVNYIGLIGRMGVKVQQHERRIEELEAKLAAALTRIEALEAA